MSRSVINEPAPELVLLTPVTYAHRRDDKRYDSAMLNPNVCCRNGGRTQHPWGPEFADAK